MGETNGHKEAQAWLCDMANATAFLTRLPIPAIWQNHSRSIAQSSRAFPLVGILIGGITALLLYGCRALGLAPLTAAALVLAATALLTGGLHEDGLADMADGFGGGKTRERKLEIMRDSRIGTYGVLALVSTLLIKASAVAELSWPAIILAACLSRAAMVWLMWSTPHARADGLSAQAGRPDRVAMVQVLILAGLASLLMAFVGQSPQSIVAAVILCALAAVAVRQLALHQIKGQTGDVCGTVQIVTEAAMLSMLTAAFW